MADYDDNNRGVLFKNSRKEKETHPDLSGELNINGTVHWLNAWSKVSANGNKFISISIGKPKDNQPEASEKSEETKVVDDNDIW
jgi:uncharacterized protein (DUF736 family)